MKLLLDTCTFLWLTTDDPELSHTAKLMFQYEDNAVYLSSVSAWEIMVKNGLDNLPLPDKADSFIQQQFRRSGNSFTVARQIRMSGAKSRARPTWLIFTKLYDELACHRGRYKNVRFRNTNTTAQLKNSIQNLFDDAKKEWEGVFPPDERIKLNPDHLSVCIGSLEEWKDSSTL
jgi:hypothetical protein